MSWIKLIPMILKFLLTDLPKIIEQMRLASKDKKYNKSIDRYNAALDGYKKTKSLDSLNELSK